MIIMYLVGRFVKKYRFLIVGLLVIGALGLWGPWTYAVVSSAGNRYDSTHVEAGAVPTRRVALVFGAGVHDGRPTPYLQYRVEAAAALYKAGRIQKLLMTGDNSRKNYDEPAVMKRVAVELGVKADDIIVDDAGFSTYDSCYRAKHVFRVDSAILVSQSYHLPRAILACEGVGIDSIGYGARSIKPLLVAQYTGREWLSTDKIVIQLLTRSKSKFVGTIEPIT